ncbi:MAG TPA: 4a-hydroxytetrahydrobiopterin dehydratase [Elusimicrobiota bacterium]|nr:4a-hydroxytetrahydrobiopterin dehydratase [Elusimicrobiota bacterium]
MHNSNGRRSGTSRTLAQPLGLKEAKALLSELKGWTLVAGKALRKEFVTKDFMAAVRLIDVVARAAEAEGHHPDLHLTGYRRLVIELSTHALGALSMRDFILAERIDALAAAEGHPPRRRHPVAA